MKWLRIFASTIIVMSSYLRTVVHAQNLPDTVLIKEYKNKAINFAESGNLDSALFYFREALKCTQNDEIGAARIYNNIGIVYNNFRSADSALYYFNKSEQILIKYPIHRSMMASLHNSRGTLFLKSLDYEKAIQYFMNALSNLSEISGQDSQKIVQVNRNIGLAYYNQGKYNKSIQFFKNCVQLKLYQPHVKIINIYDDLARNYNKLDSLTMADSLFRFSINYLMQQEGAQLKLANSYNHYGLFFYGIGEYEKALLWFNDAHNIYCETDTYKPVENSKILFNIGKAHFKQCSLDSALYYYQKAVSKVVKNFDNENMKANPTLDDTIFDYLHLSHILSKKAEVFWEIYGISNDISDLHACSKTNDLAIQLLEKKRIEVMDESKNLFVSVAEPAYENAIKFTLELLQRTRDICYKDTLFHLAERGKSALLRSSLQALQYKNLAGIPDSIQEYERTLKIAMSRLNKKINYNDINSISNKSNYSDLLIVTQKYDSLVDYIRINYTEYYALKHGDQVIPTAILQKRIPENQAIIEYTLLDRSAADETILICVITRDRNEIIMADIDTAFSSNFESYLKALKNNDFKNHTKDDLEEFKHAAFGLYSKLIGPLAHIVKDKQLIIIPDGYLWYIPFESLLTNQVYSVKINYSELPYLIKKHPISYGYSATIMYGIKGDQSKRLDRKVLAMAPFAKNDDRDNDSIAAILRHYDPPLKLLPGSGDEANMACSIFGGDALLADQATEKNFKDLSSLYQIIHLISHGIIDDNNPLYSRIPMYPESGDTVDFELQTYELFNRQFSAELAVLSACNTGMGKLQKGEGIMSIARGFAYAGVPSIIMTLWSVQDYSSTRLIESFYGYLRDGNDKAVALKQAKIDFLAGAKPLEAHPHFWAGYVCIGETAPITRSDYNLWLLLTIIPLIFGLHFWWRRAIGRKHQVKSYL